MIESTAGIILRTRPLTETSLIVHWLTRDWGRLATVAKGARRPRSPFLGQLDLFYVADFSFSRSRRSDLHVLREVAVREIHSALRADLLRLRGAAYAAALVEQATEAETPLPAVHDLLLGYLERLCHKPAPPQLVFAFELKFLHELGLGPAPQKTSLTPGAIQIVHALTRNDWPACSRLRLSEAQKAELRRFLHGFLVFHLGRLPRGRAAALAQPGGEDTLKIA